MTGRMRRAFTLLLFACIFAAVLAQNANAAGVCLNTWDCGVQGGQSSCTLPCTWGCVECEGAGCSCSTGCPYATCARTDGCTGPLGISCSGFAQAECALHTGCSWSSCGGENENCIGTGQSTCCEGLACYSGKCHATCVNLNQPCGASDPYGKDCCAGQGSCVDTGGGQYRCQNCLPTGSAEECGADSECCSGICNLGPGSASYKKCVSCLPSIGKTCTGSGQGNCCNGLLCRTDGMCRQNAAPGQPQKPNIEPNAITQWQAASCVQNCPPSSLPLDPDGDAVTLQYRWQKNGDLSAWENSPSSYACSPALCSPNDEIRIRSRACDAHGACTESELSSPSTVIVVPPPPSSGFDLGYIIAAVLIGFSLLALAYMVSKAFNLAQWTPIIADEIWQVLATAVVALCLIGLQIAVDDYLVDIVAGAGQTVQGTGMGRTNDFAYGRLSDLSLSVKGVETSLSSTASDIGKQASKGVFCNMLGLGFTLVNCSPLNAFRGSMTTGAFTVVVGLVDIYAQQFLLTLAKNYGFSLLIPLGLFFRCFKLSRQAGGALIAIGFGLYTVYPLVIVVVSGALSPLDSPLQKPVPHSLPAIGTCDPYDTGTLGRDQFHSVRDGIIDQRLANHLTYLVLVETIFMSVLNLIITLGFIAAFAKVLGNEIDLSGLVRIG